LLDPENPLYRPSPASATAATGGQAAADLGPGFTAADDTSAAAGAHARPRSQADDDLEALLMGTRASSSDSGVDFDLDHTHSPGTERAEAKELDFDLDLDTSAASAPDEPAPRAAAPNFDLDSMNAAAPPSQPPPVVPAAPARVGLPPEVQELSLDLDLDETLAAADSLQTKLSLAQEFLAIGDTDGARALAQEVQAEASGALKERASAFLAQLP